MQTGPGDKPVRPKLKKKAPAAKRTRTPKVVPSEVKDTKGAADIKRAEPTVRRELKRIRTKQSQIKDTKGNADRLPEKQRQKIVSDNTPLHADLSTSAGRKLRDDAAKAKAKQAATARKVTAPAIKVLNVAARPSHAVAGGADALVQGKGLDKAGKAAVRGLKGKGHTTFSTVLKHAGVKNKVVRGVAGFGLDVATDPLTYVTFGAGSVAKNAAAKEAQRVLEKAQNAGMSEEGARKVAARAAKNAEAKAAKNKGLQIGVRAKVPLVDKAVDVKTSGRLTAAISRKAGASKVATRVRESGPVQGAGKALVHDFKPKGRTPETHAAIREGLREHRARTAAAARATERRYGKALRKTVRTDGEYRQVVDAIESGTVAQLPDRLRNAAQATRGDLNVLHKQAHKRGLSRGKLNTDAVKVPAVTADVKQSAKDLAFAQRARASAEKEHKVQLKQAGVAQGRAEVLSRNVNGVAGERAASSSDAAVRLAESRAGRRARPRDVLAHIDRMEQRAETYGGGGLGVSQARGRLDLSAENVKVQRRLEKAAEEQHVATVGTARSQQLAKRRALKLKEQRAGDAKGYVPHVNQIAMDGGKGGRGGTTRVSADKGRAIRKTLKTLREEGDQTFSENLPRVLATKANKESGRASLHDFWHKVAATGRQVKPHRDLHLANDGSELVYKVSPHGLEPVAKTNPAGEQVLDKDALNRVLTGKAAGRYVVLRKADVEDAKGRLANTPSDDDVLRLYDKAQGFLKTVYTVPNPAYHLRNLYGDSINAFLGDTSLHSVKQAAQVLESRVLKHRAERSASQFTGAKRSIENRPVAKVVKRARRAATLTYASNGAIDKSGATALEFANKHLKPAGGNRRVARVPSPRGGGKEYFYFDNSGKAVGYLFASGGKDTSRSVFVDPSARRKGVATRLYEEAAKDGYNMTSRRGNSQTDLGYALQASLRKTDKTVTIRGKKVTHDQLLKEAEEHGAISQGFIGRELTDLTGKSGPVQRASQYREDLLRLGTFLSARKRGMTASQASEWVAKHHFDYADVTGFERKVARRAIPFYTFFARNTRLQATKVLTRPGKVATFSKVLNDTAQAAGFDTYDEYAKDLKDYEQRGLPVPIKVDGKVYNAFVQPPQTDLNQLTAHPGDQLQSLANRVTFFKTIGELALNYSVFFQGPIQDEQHPLVEAPEEVRHLPGLVQKKLGVTHDWINPKTGKKSWAWPAKVDYTIRSLPEGNFVLGQMLPGRGTRNQTPAQSRLAFATGVRVTPLKTDARDLSQVKSAVFELDKQLAKLRDSGKAEDPKLKGHYTVAYQRLLDERKKLMDQRGGIETKLGMPDAKSRRLKRRPLTDDEKFDKKLQDFVNKDPAKDVEDRLNKFLESAR